MQSEYKIKQFKARLEMVGISKKNCSDMTNSANNQSILIATHKSLYRLQFLEGKYNLNHVKISSKNDEEEFHLLETCTVNKNETYIYICTRFEKKEMNEVMVFRNDFKDLVDTIHLPFKPIIIKNLLHNESIYTLFVGEAMTALFVLTNQKDKKLSLVQIYDMPISLSNSAGAVCIDYFIEKQILHVALGFLDGSIKMYDFPIDTDDKQIEKQTPKFFTKQHTLLNETKLQFPITSVYFSNFAPENSEEENYCLVMASSLGYVICFDNVIKNRLDEPIALPLKNESKLDSVMDCIVADVDNDGEKELIAVTYLSDLFVIKKEESTLKIIASKEIDSCFFNVYFERHGDQNFIILCGDNEVQIFEFLKGNK